MTQKKEYVKPALVVHGTVEKLTQGSVVFGNPDALYVGPIQNQVQAS
jgi:hypothetical protein